MQKTEAGRIGSTMIYLQCIKCAREIQMTMAVESDEAGGRRRASVVLRYRNAGLETPEQSTKNIQRQNSK